MVTESVSLSEKLDHIYPRSPPELEDTISTKIFTKLVMTYIEPASREGIHFASGIQNTR